MFADLDEGVLELFAEAQDKKRRDEFFSDGFHISGHTSPEKNRQYRAEWRARTPPVIRKRIKRAEYVRNRENHLAYARQRNAEIPREERLRRRREEYRRNREKRLLKSKAKDEACKAKGICLACKKQEVVEGYVRCNECLKRNRIYARRAQKKRCAEGKCMRCVRPAEPGKLWCSECLKRNRERNARDWERRKKSAA